MLFGVCMTVHWLLVFKLKPCMVRKCVGLVFICIGAFALFKLSDYSEAQFTVLVALTSSGLALLFGRDRSRKAEGES
ncbi:hypothetical protein DBY65_001700 [Pseudomonas sp. RIT412]|nr:hypothetical protein DBP26_000820 [Pseudomonas sp. RIT 409]RAU55879.1 hypothetical protein DBY65_001700 [Pseudomonas sp. RIT 412]